jgi:hypothetical protein
MTNTSPCGNYVVRVVLGATFVFVVPLFLFNNSVMDNVGWLLLVFFITGWPGSF